MLQALQLHEGRVEEWTPESFVAYCGHVATFSGHPAGPLIDYRIPDIIGIDYEKCYEGAVKRKKEWLLTKEEFEQIREGPCYMCGKDNTETHQNGLDRINNDIGYQFDNLQACCGWCNKLKREFSLEAILQKCSQVFETCESRVTFKTGQLEKDKRNSKAN